MVGGMGEYFTCMVGRVKDQCNAGSSFRSVNFLSKVVNVMGKVKKIHKATVEKMVEV
jgi:hypothetical protein